MVFPARQLTVGHCLRPCQPRSFSFIPCGNVTIPPNHRIPEVLQVIEVRYLYAHRESNALYQPIYQGLRSDVDPEECRLSQLKYKPED